MSRFALLLTLGVSIGLWSCGSGSTGGGSDSGSGSSGSGSSGSGSVAETTQFTAVKTIMSSECASRHMQSWTTNEAAFKADLANIQSRVASGNMPQGRVLTSDQKAKFASYPN